MDSSSPRQLKELIVAVPVLIAKEDSMQAA
jgi:hypothetical protein